MKIIKPAPSAENWNIKVYCTGFGQEVKGCGAKLKVYREDLRYTPGDKDVEAEVTMKCIGCGAVTTIGMEYYPPNHKRLKRITK